jgi:hypothetical protein
MTYIFEMPEYAETVRISDIRWLNYTEAFVSKLNTYGIKTIYIAPKSQIILYKNQLKKLKMQVSVEVHPFEGGFKSNSITLFPLNTTEDLKYFNHITGLTLGKYGILL